MTNHVTCRITVLSDRYWWTFVLRVYWRPLYCLFARLYKSPQQAVKNSSSHNSSYDWLRTEFDRPSPELSSARRSLAVKLDQVTKRKSASLCIVLTTSLQMLICVDGSVSSGMWYWATCFESLTCNLLLTTPCLKKTVQICFSQNFVKFTPILIIFGRKTAKRLKLYEMHSFSTSPNLHRHTTVLNTDVPKSYRTLKVKVDICNKLSNDLVSTQQTKMWFI